MAPRRSRAGFGAVAALVAALALTGATAAPAAVEGASNPIIIGAAMDLTANMSPYDTPGLYAVQARAREINAKGGINGRRIEIKVCNHQLKRQKACAAQLIRQGADIGLVTCDVEFAAPATQEFINRGILALAPCIGTDQQGPKRFGTKGKLAFSLGSIAQDEGAAMAEYAFARGWRDAVIVKDNLIAYFRNIADSFENRFRSLGGRIVQEEAFTSFDKTINNAITKVAPTKADVIVFPTAFSDLPTFVSGIRSLGNKTPIFNSWGGDGNYWWTKEPQVTNYYYVTYGSLYGDDPNPAVNALVKAVTRANGGKLPATGSFVPGAAVVDAIAAAIKRAGGSTNGAALAAQFEKFRGLPTTVGRITFTPQLHGVTRRPWRVMRVNNNKAEYVQTWVTKKLATIE
jgi:branched-chain amino acid transport system substrate-binding protein